jgi:NAD-dependent dihydropyrimidine dehydrogenase PreA subunit
MSYHISDLCNGCTACVRLCPVAAITGERKTMHIINPSLCIECGACGRICPQDALRNAAGAACKHIAKLSLWPKPVIDVEQCISCRICVEGCPVHCLDLGRHGQEKHEHPFIAEPKACIACGFCAIDCPVEAILLAVPHQSAAEVARG